MYILPVSKDPHRYVCGAAGLAAGCRGNAVIRVCWQAQTFSSVSLKTLFTSVCGCSYAPPSVSLSVDLLVLLMDSFYSSLVLLMDSL